MGRVLQTRLAQNLTHGCCSTFFAFATSGGSVATLLPLLATLLPIAFWTVVCDTPSAFAALRWLTPAATIARACLASCSTLPTLGNAGKRMRAAAYG
jgi:hypothetical protein